MRYALWSLPFLRHLNTSSCSRFFGVTQALR
jgi:hypothetical protein